MGSPTFEEESPLPSSQTSTNTFVVDALLFVTLLFICISSVVLGRIYLKKRRELFILREMDNANFNEDDADIIGPYENSTTENQNPPVSEVDVTATKTKQKP